MIIQPFFKTQDTLALGKLGAKNRNIQTGGCEACGLYKTCKSPKMPAAGLGKKKILIIAEAPGANEDLQGVPLSGGAGRRLRGALAKVGINLDEDCRKINAVNCRPPKNRVPSDKEVALCRPRILQEIKEFEPTIILALGHSAMKSLCQHRSAWDLGFPTMTNWQGEIIPDQELQCYIVPTWHPAFLDKIDDNPVYERRWLEDMQKVATLAEKGARPAIYDFYAMVDLLITPAQAVKRLSEIYDYLRNAPQDTFISFDYETTGLKPYLDGHKIICASLAWSDSQAVSFSLGKETWPILAKILRNPRIKKAAHNMKFEALWTRVRAWPDNAPFEVRSWLWDSMLAAHVLDNRTGRTGLKFQTYARFGVLGYDNNAGPYIRATKKGANSFNRVQELPIRELLLYCGLDSLFEHRLATYQRKEIENQGLMPAYQLLHDGALALVDCEYNGICIDLAYCEKQKNYLTNRISHAKKKILEYPEVQTWRKMYADNFNLGSSTQLSKLLYEKLQVPIAKHTASGAASVDKATLEDIEIPFVQDLLKIRRLEKINSTYLQAYLSEAPDGWLHPFYHLNKVVSFRGSCSDPNFQNVPKRDSEAQKIVRRALLARPGMCWFEVDYSGIEVRIAATYHKDPNMIKYLQDPNTDMHRDTAMDLCMLSKEQTSKYLRQSAKNGFVFAQFYGDWYKACAENLWHKWFNSPDALLADGKTHIKTWLAKKGIKSLEKFTKHVQEVESIFWEERFPVYNEWRKDHWETYKRKGYFWGHTGFKYTSIMDRNDAINYGTQGSAFHCLLWSLIQVNNRLKKEHWKSILIGQIHDAMDGNAEPTEINDLLSMIRNTMIDALCEKFDWINVPIDVEFEMSPINKSWYELKGISKRPYPCACGLEWGYNKKESDGAIRWSCPVCEHFDVER